MRDDDWRSWKNGKNDNRYKGVKRHSGKSGSTRTIVIAVVIICAIIGGYFVFQTYGTPQTMQNEANNMIQKTGNTIQQISSQVGKQTTSLLQNNSLTTTPSSTISSANDDTRVAIAVYHNCHSFIRTDLKTIDTTCHDLNYSYYKQFKFNVPDVLEQAFPGQAFDDMNSTVYQYGSNNFKLGLHDQVGEKDYDVSLWQLPQ